MNTMTAAQAVQQDNRHTDGTYATKVHAEQDSFTPPDTPTGDGDAAARVWEKIRDDEDSTHDDLDYINVDDDDGYSFRLFVGEVATQVAARDFPDIAVTTDCTTDEELAYDGFTVSLEVAGKGRALALSAGWKHIDELVPAGTAKGMDTVRAVHDKMTSEIALLVDEADALGLACRK